ncbi:hypothetical protein [Intrasporangium sp.]|uniref:hypothetical protein n=1 Tax=Intrasporangium sp. TaxID=1925024 RepID=UPI00293AB8E2|nr:hypothetical protein [Intrasporangium sp.]MDV3220203.1 hypothetical protein [Intrasporangium sp.]
MRVVRVRVTRVSAALLVSTAVVVASCSGNPGVEISQAPRGSVPTQTVTVTVSAWRTATQTVTATTTMVTPTTVLATPTVTVTLPPRPVVTSTAPFDQARAMASYQAIIGDITALDATGGAGASAALRFESLARHLTVLETTTAPPGLDPPSFFGRVASLRLFADAASAEALAGSPQAPARYAVIRSEVAVLLSMVNGALRTSLALPTPPATTAP